MKKIFLFLAVASTAVFTSCSSDDDSKTTTDPNAATSIVLAANVTTIELGESVTFTVTDNNAKVVTGSSTISANNVEISGATFTPDAVGSFVMTATHKNTNGLVISSNSVTVTVTAPVVGPAANSILINGTNHPINTSILIFWGGYDANNPDNPTTATHGMFSYVMTDDTTGEVIYDTTTANNYLDAEMIVPLNAEGAVDFPTPANATYLDFYEVIVNGAEVVATSQGTGTMTIGALPEAINMPHTFTMATTYNNGSVLAADFNGNWLGFLDGTAAKPATASKTNKAVSAKVFTKAEIAQNKAKFFASLKK